MSDGGTARPGSRESVFVALPGIPRVLRHAAWQPADPGEGKGLGVLLVPGFGFGDTSLALTSAWLRNRNYRPAGARIGFSVGCTRDLVGRSSAGPRARSGDAGQPGALPGRPDRSAEHVEVRTSHTGMAFAPDVYLALSARLAAWASGRPVPETRAEQPRETTTAELRCTG
jgi:hypothetical protein